MTLSLPRKLDDDTVFALWHFLNDLNDAFDQVYGHQIRRAIEARKPAVNPEQPWLPFDDNAPSPEF
jgi:hypothetical protein